MPGQLRYFLLVMVLTSLAPDPARAQRPEWLEQYKDGLDAIEVEDWRRAALHMQRAAAGRGEESRRLPKYLYFKPYIPHFYMGLAAFKLGNCSAAMEAWSRSERQGVIEKRPEYQQIILARALCMRQAREVPVQTAPPVAPPPPPPPASVPTAQSPAAPSSAKSRTELPSPRPAPSPSPARRSEPPPPIDPPELRGDVPSRYLPLRPSGEPSAELLGAVSAFLGGSYEQVVSQLEAADLEDPFARAQGHLLQAAAELAIYLEGGERDAARLDSARRHVLAVRSALPDLEPPERYFSPRFLDFFYGQRPQEGR